MKLSVKLVVAFLIMLVITVSILTTVGVTSTKNALEKKIGEGELELAKAIMDKIDRLMYERMLDMQAIAEDEEFEGYMAGRKDDLDEPEESIHKLEELQFLTGPWDNLEIFNVQGTILLSIDKDHIGEQLHEDHAVEAVAFEKALQGEVYVSDVVTSDDTGKPTIIFAAPIRNEKVVEKPIVGVVIGNFAWQVIVEILENVDITDIHLLNKEGVNIAKGGHDHAGEESQPPDPRIIEELIESPNDFRIHSSGLDTNKETLTATARQQGHLRYEGSDWTLVLGTPTDEAFATVNTVTRNLLLLALIVIILGIVFAFFISRSITNPINQLKESATKISRGNFGEVIEIKSKDEIGELAKTFDNMRYSLRMVIDEYEKNKEVSKESYTLKEKIGLKKKKGAKKK